MTPDPDATRPPDPSQTPTYAAAGGAVRPAALPDGLEAGDELGRGGMGVVIAAREAGFDREVAVKLLGGHLCGDPAAGRRFAAEAGITARLQHPGVVPVYARGEADPGQPFFTMKRVRGRTLASFLADRSAPDQDLPRFLKWFEQICQTVAYAHSRGVTHRDLKPQNVMIGAFGEVLVMDWGLACEPGAGDPAPAGAAVGTPAYMPPEQARGEPDRVGPRSDVFGLGGILCTILAGRPPYVGTSTRTTLAQAQAADLTDAHARVVACGADPDLIALAVRCLAADPAARPADAGEVAAAVTAHLESVADRLRRAEVARAEAVARAEQAQARAAAERRARRRGLALAAAVLLAAAAGAGGWVMVRQAREEQLRSEAERALAAERADRERERAAAAEARGRLLAAQQDALEDMSIEDTRSAENLTLVVQVWEKDPAAQHVVRKIQLLQALARLAFAGTPRAREAALASWRRLEAALRDRPWFPLFLDGQKAELDTVGRPDATPAQKRQAVLAVSTTLRDIIREADEDQYIVPLREARPGWYEQAQKAAGKLADAARDGHPLEEVGSYTRFFWRLYSGELVLVEGEGVEAAMVAVGDLLDRWERAGPGAAPADVRAALGPAVQALRDACRAELAPGKK
ncbi:MAG TPA: serine/threonine-protein kinase [Urbifossiella sp.]|nr:serine/threonine-protein kinase [Urbifossiella sp.]